MNRSVVLCFLWQIVPWLAAAAVDITGSKFLSLTLLIGWATATLTLLVREMIRQRNKEYDK